MPQTVVVVIEDEPQIRRFVRTRKPDLLVLDLGLPDGDGIDFIRDVRC